jgi:hypothetical protein
MEESGRVDFHTSPYFPGSLRFLAVLMILQLLIPIHWLPKLVTVAIGLVMLTSHYRLCFDLRQKRYSHYVWVLGFRLGDWYHFDHIEYLFLKQNRMRQNLNSMTRSTTIYLDVYDGYLRISEAHKIHLITSRAKEPVKKKLLALGQLLQVDVVDYTTD